MTSCKLVDMYHRL